ncbi:hypothetical protein CNYM01_07565 [Colletotrichum nymphaeae SA-01]|uniref:Uncharacterized protein n=1 Tax=Colletotrichum nymphaeae SA-01 TaxID=1460502 RepID=A0A135SE79_9PEZI|nr:hypothetical protein CNYM01_07565 [Colletotrichum nymphaeae SA-01]
MIRKQTPHPFLLFSFYHAGHSLFVHYGLATDFSKSDKMVLANIVEDLGKSAYPVISEVLEDMVQATVQQNNEGIPTPSATSPSDNTSSVPSRPKDGKSITSDIDKLQIQYDLLRQRMSSFEKTLNNAEKKRKKLVKIRNDLERKIDACKSDIQSLEHKLSCAEIKSHDLEVSLEIETSESWGSKTKRDIHMKKIEKSLHESDRFIERHEERQRNLEDKANNSDN